VFVLFIFGRYIPRPVAYTSVSLAALFLGWTAPSKVRQLAFCVALFLIAAMWSFGLYSLLLTTSPPVDGGSVNEGQVAGTSFLLAIATSAVFVGGLVFLGLVFASEFLLGFSEIYGLSRAAAIRTLASGCFGMQYPYLIIENGQATVSKPKGLLARMGGPGMVIVRPANAVVFERIGRVTQIAGPGTTYTRLYEFTKGIVQLRPCWISFPLDVEVFTLDGIALKVSGGIGARIEPADATEARIDAAGGPALYRWASSFRGRIGGEFPVYQDSVFRAVYLPAGPDWQKTLCGMALSSIQDAVSVLRLEDIYGEPKRGLPAVPAGVASITAAIEAQALRRLQTLAVNWGIQVTALDVKSLEPPEEIRQRVLKRWSSATEAQILADLGEAEAATMGLLDGVNLTAFQRTLQSLGAAAQTANATLGTSQALRFQRVLQTIANTMRRDPTTALRYIEALDKLSKQPNARVYIGMGRSDAQIEE
jgi:regulator of protease activity HflC (stomatin/prohibitin superfamily)